MLKTQFTRFFTDETLFEDRRIQKWHSVPFVFILKACCLKTFYNLFELLGIEPRAFHTHVRVTPQSSGLILYRKRTFLIFLKTYKILTEEGWYDSYLLSVNVTRMLEGFEVILGCMCCRPARATDLTT